MSSDACADKIFILDALTHSLNMSVLELMTLLSSQAPISNLLLVPALKLQPTAPSTLLAVPSMHQHNKIPVVPTVPGAPPAAVLCEPENDLYKEFIILYWCSLTFVVLVAMLALWTKLAMSVRKNLDERKPDPRAKPLTDVERWCMRRQKMREVEAERQEEKRMHMELGRG